MRGSAFLFLIFWAQAVSPPCHRLVRHFSKNKEKEKKKKLGHVRCPTCFLCPVHVGRGHDTPNAISCFPTNAQ